jgi:hypothetical protein
MQEALAPTWSQEWADLKCLGATLLELAVCLGQAEEGWPPSMARLAWWRKGSTRDDLEKQDRMVMEFQVIDPNHLMLG